MNLKWKIFFLVLLIATISIQGYTLYTYATVQQHHSAVYFCYIAFQLDSEPEKYWNLTEPYVDPYVLEAIENPDNFTKFWNLNKTEAENWTEPFDYRDSPFWYAPGWLEWSEWWPLPFKYNGTYYQYGDCIAGRRLVVTLLDEEPEEYWNLTDPDKYTLEAIENPGETIVVGIGLRLTLQPGPFQYNGKYYTASMIERDYGYPPHSRSEPIKPEYVAIALAGVWGAVGSAYIVSNRRTKAES